MESRRTLKKNTNLVINVPNGAIETRQPPQGLPRWRSGGFEVLEAHIAFDAPATWREDIVGKHDARVTILNWLHRDECCCKVFVEIEVKPGREEALLEALRSSTTIENDDLTIVGPGRVKGALSTDECIGCCSTLDTGVFQMGGHIDASGRLVQILVAPDRDTVREMVSSMELHGHNVTLLKLASMDPEELLTSRQETILVTALERGYFDEHKGTSLVDLAREFHVSVSTASEILRKATHKIMTVYFGSAEFA
jgi:predicted DNA binding protein